VRGCIFLGREREEEEGREGRMEKGREGGKEVVPLKKPSWEGAYEANMGASSIILSARAHGSSCPLPSFPSLSSSSSKGLASAAGGKGEGP